MYKIIGIKNVDYVNKSGVHVSGTELHTVFEDRRIEGYGVEKFYLSERVISESGVSSFFVDDVIDVFYNKFGNVGRISVVSQKES